MPINYRQLYVKQFLSRMPLCSFFTGISLTDGLDGAYIRMTNEYEISDVDNSSSCMVYRLVATQDEYDLHLNLETIIFVFIRPLLYSRSSYGHLRTAAKRVIPRCRSPDIRVRRR
jgi:hypothetical protein